jgi:Zn-dependent peptidase ImmA (M78 family)
VKFVKIGPIKYQIVEEPGLCNRDHDIILDGVISYSESKISIEANLLPQAKRHTLWHEVTHAILMQAGIVEHDERLVTALAYGIMDVLQKNPELREDAK